MTGRAETGEKSKSVAVQTKTDKVVMRAENLVAVSYTHLTLPTKRIV